LCGAGCSEATKRTKRRKRAAAAAGARGPKHAEDVAKSAPLMSPELVAFAKTAPSTEKRKNVIVCYDDEACADQWLNINDEVAIFRPKRLSLEEEKDKKMLRWRVSLNRHFQVTSSGLKTICCRASVLGVYLCNEDLFSFRETEELQKQIHDATVLAQPVVDKIVEYLVRPEYVWLFPTVGEKRHLVPVHRFVCSLTLLFHIFSIIIWFCCEALSVYTLGSL
jgi:hypothetical protein